MLKLGFSSSELMRRAQKLIGNKGKVIAVAPTLGGRVYLVNFVRIGLYGWEGKLEGQKFTVWEIIEAQGFGGSANKSFFVGLSKCAAPELEALNLAKMPSNQQELKRAYRKAAKEHHPDTGGSVDMFRFVEGAYRRLLLHFEALPFR